MSTRKRFLFAMLLTAVVLAAAGRLSVYKAEFDVPQPNTWSRAPVPDAAALRWYDSLPANMPSRWLEAFRMKGELLPALFLPVQSKNPQDLGVGKLLVASRSLGDPDFARTVVLLVRYDENGALGLILNRRTDVPISKLRKTAPTQSISGALWDLRPCLHCLSPRPRWKRLRISSVGCI
jgi:hypothetical protein